MAQNGIVPQHAPITPAQQDELAIELLMTARSLFETAKILEAAALRIRPPRRAPSHITPQFPDRPGGEG